MAVKVLKKVLAWLKRFERARMMSHDGSQDTRAVAPQQQAKQCSLDVSKEDCLSAGGNCKEYVNQSMGDPTLRPQTSGDIVVDELARTEHFLPGAPSIRRTKQPRRTSEKAHRARLGNLFSSKPLRVPFRGLKFRDEVKREAGSDSPATEAKRMVQRRVGHTNKGTSSHGEETDKLAFEGLEGAQDTTPKKEIDPTPVAAVETQGGVPRDCWGRLFAIMPRRASLRSKTKAHTGDGTQEKPNELEKQTEAGTKARKVPQHDITTEASRATFTSGKSQYWSPAKGEIKKTVDGDRELRFLGAPSSSNCAIQGSNGEYQDFAIVPRAGVSSGDSSQGSPSGHVPIAGLLMGYRTNSRKEGPDSDEESPWGVKGQFVSAEFSDSSKSRKSLRFVNFSDVVNGLKSMSPESIKKKVSWDAESNDESSEVLDNQNIEMFNDPFVEFSAKDKTN